MIRRDDRVVYRADPILFGVLVVTWVRTDGRVECVTAVEADRARARAEEMMAGFPCRLRGEVFERSELVAVEDFIEERAA